MSLRACVRTFAAGLISLTMIAGSQATQTPAALRGNSIVLSWSDLITWKNRDDEMKNKSHIITIRVYVSAQDRVFSSYDFRNVSSRRHRGGSTADEVSGGNENKLHWKFEGGALIADQQFGRHGARRVVVSFSDDFKQCTTKVIVAKASGSAEIRSQGLGMDQITISSETCSMQSGNIFATPDSTQ